MNLNASLVESNAFEKHLINRKRKKNWGKKETGFSLMLTSMIDMFSILVIFLLQTFSGSPEISVTKGIELPNSITSKMVTEAPVLSISSNGNLYLNQELVGETNKVVKAPDMLLKKLIVIKNNWAEKHKDMPFPGEVNLQADRSIPSTTVSVVMGVLTNSDYQSIQLAVIGRK